jgi:hypothetical protein
MNATVSSGSSGGSSASIARGIMDLQPTSDLSTRMSTSDQHKIAHDRGDQGDDGSSLPIQRDCGYQHEHKAGRAAIHPRLADR